MKDEGRRLYVPRRIFFTSGSGIHKERLASFEMALRAASIAPFNLVRVSSIFPPHCQIISPEAGAAKMAAGQIIHCVMSENATNEPNRLIAASIGAAIPEDKNLYGYLSEHHSFGESQEEAGKYAEYLAIEMFATLRGYKLNASLENEISKDSWQVSNDLLNTRNITQVTRGDAAGLWTTVIAAAVLLPG